VLQIPQGGTELDVQCNCGCKFCVGCLDEGHAPVSCLCLRNWKGKDADDSMTATWLKANTSAVLQLPSAIVAQDSVVLINPRHRDAAQIKAVTRERFVYDGRLRHS
jgi:hypothetical protein